MDARTFRERVRRIIVSAPTLSEAMMSGGFRSMFRGRGMDFESLREYEAGDDALRIDWNATARFGRAVPVAGSGVDGAYAPGNGHGDVAGSPFVPAGKPFVKTYHDDRELTVFSVIDESPSMAFGAVRTKAETAALTASLLAWAASMTGSRAGVLCFGGATGADLRMPATGTSNSMVLLERLAGGTRQNSGADSGIAGTSRGSDLGSALEAARSVLKRRSLIFVFSDWATTGWALPLAFLARRHDVVAVRVSDTLDSAPPETTVSLRASDAESFAPRLVVPRSAGYRQSLKEEASARRLEWRVGLSAARVPFIEMDGESDPVAALVTFFGARRRVR